MDQLKEFLRQCIKYRFWISIGVAALFAIIAYFVGSGPVQAKAEQETKAIIQADNDVKQFAVAGRSQRSVQADRRREDGVLTKDVNTAWKQLYNRQAPLLTWPKTVQERFRKWGRNGPRMSPKAPSSSPWSITSRPIRNTSTEVYKVFHPFDYETGKGIVAAPPKEALLRPAVFDPTKLPELGTIWAAQERLWIQRTVLEVVAQVNRKAKDWDSAIIKQINLLEVGTSVGAGPAVARQGRATRGIGGHQGPGLRGRRGSGRATGMLGGTQEAMMKSGMGRGMGGAGCGGGRRDRKHLLRQARDDKGQFKILPDHAVGTDRPRPHPGPSRRAGKFPHVHPGHGLRAAAPGVAGRPSPRREPMASFAGYGET